EPGFGAWMHKTAQEVVRLSFGCRIEAAERYRLELVRMGDPSAKSPDLAIGLPAPAMDVARDSCLFQALREVLASEKKTWDSVPQSPATLEQGKRYVEMVEV